MLLKWMSALGLTYLAVRQTYRYFWQPLDIAQVLRKKALSIKHLQPLQILVSKQLGQPLYILEARHHPAPSLARSVVMKYQSSKELAILYSPQRYGINQLFVSSERQMVGKLFPNSFEAELNHFLILNKHVLEAEVPYKITYELTDLEDHWSLTFDIEKAQGDSGRQPSIPFEELFDPKRYFAVTQKATEGQPTQRYVLVTSQDQANLDKSFFVQPTSNLFIDRQTLRTLLVQGKIESLHEVFRNSPLCEQINSISLEGNVTINLGNSNIIQTKAILKDGHHYYNLMLLHI